VKYGNLRLRTLALAVPAGASIRHVVVQRKDTPRRVTWSQEGPRIAIQLEVDHTLQAGESIEVDLNW
jgi:hypothetical protein